MGQAIRESTTTGTIPTFTAISGGTFTSDTNVTSTLLYTGTDDIKSIFPMTHCGPEGMAWIYIASATPKLARVLAVVEVDLTNPAALIYSLLLDRAMPSVSGATGNTVEGDLKKYSVTNTGDAAGVFDGVALESGVTVSQEIQYPLNVDWLEVKDFNASGTTFLISENK